MATAPDEDIRTADRRALLTRAPMIEDGFPFGTVRVRNISPLGLGGVASEILEPGQRFAVFLPGLGEVGGSVIWARGVRFGFNFDEPIDLAELALPDLAETKLPGRYTDRKRYREPGKYKRPGFHHF